MRKIWPLLLALVAGALWYFERPGSVDSIGVERQAPLERTAENDIEALFDLRRTDVQVRGAGTVLRTLSDDDEGSRHQRFILELASGRTLLVAHNIDLAPRIGSLKRGDRVEFYGEYEWNEKGGVIHWTHGDPRGRHVPGWLKHEGKIYQ